MQILIFLLLSFLLSASSTHSVQTLRHYFMQQSLPDEYHSLWPAVKNDSTEALQQLADIAVLRKDRYWLKQAASFGSLPAQLALVELSEHQDKKHWLIQAANNGHGASQFELSLLDDSSDQGIRYLKQAAVNQYTPAIIALSEYYYEKNDLVNALHYLEKAVQLDSASNVKLARIYWQQGDTNKATETFRIASESLPEANEYYRAIKQIKRSNLSVLTATRKAFPTGCSQYLQFVATTLDSVLQARRFKKEFENDKRLASLPICIAPILWLQSEQLKCELAHERQYCDLSHLADKHFAPNYTHLVFFLEKGKAYVQDGAMYLDQNDAYSVFVHELAHFVGFVDEYAVNAKLSEHYCRKTTAPNLLISENLDIQSSNEVAQWRQHIEVINQQRIDSAQAATKSDLLTLEISPSRTCSKLAVNAYKPSNKMTFMEYHDSHYIPPIYVYMWNNLLRRYHQDIAVSELFVKQSQKNNKG